MKDILSVLQSRVDKRSGVITHYSDSPWVVAEIVPIQKEDKKIMAEIISLRRQLKQMSEVVDRYHRGEEI